MFSIFFPSRILIPAPGLSNFTSDPHEETGLVIILYNYILKGTPYCVYKTIILPAVLYGCETWSPTSREEHRFRVFVNRVLRRIFGTKRNEVTGGWRKLHNEELHGLYSSPSIVRVIKTRRMRWAGHVARMAEVRGVYNILVGRPEGRRPLERPSRRWKDNIKMDLGETGFGDVDWIHLDEDRDRWRALVNTVMNLRVP
jgi:hypothetical protein